MAPWESTLVAKSDDMSLIPGAHMVEGKQEKSSSGNSTPTGCHCQVANPENMQIILYKLDRLFLGIYICIFIYIACVNEKRSWI